ncbi:hypothetical protein VNO77_21073 [Canavalia gladiata]|uniref:Uncharacterized protein n=1 Tax=Canavalia gladiata TaxID=3824 RepID=A0AAN9QN22_CANGL
MGLLLSLLTCCRFYILSVHCNNGFALIPVDLLSFLQTFNATFGRKQRRKIMSYELGILKCCKGGDE